MDGLGVLAVVLAIYMTPSLVAFMRGVSSPWSIVVINALLGWTLIGWAVALAMAVRSVTKPAPAPKPQADTAEGMNKLAELRGQGLLTDEEFTTAKTRLLN